jgi:hypothetical protein
LMAGDEHLVDVNAPIDRQRRTAHLGVMSMPRLYCYRVLLVPSLLLLPHDGPRLSVPRSFRLCCPEGWEKRHPNDGEGQTRRGHNNETNKRNAQFNVMQRSSLLTAGKTGPSTIHDLQR